MLHTINKSPFSKNSLSTCLRLAAANSDLLLIEDGVYGALKGTAIETAITDAIKIHKVYVLSPDMRARGISPEQIIDGIKLVDYAGFVDLAVRNAAVQSWL